METVNTNIGMSEIGGVSMVDCYMAYAITTNVSIGELKVHEPYSNHKRKLDVKCYGHKYIR